MKIQKRHLATAISLTLTLLFAASFITTLPLTFAQTKISMTVTNTRQPSIVGINQNVLLIAWLRPSSLSTQSLAGGAYRQINHGFTFVITRPDSTEENIVVDTNIYSEAIIWYNCTQLGTYRYRTYYPGDETQNSVNTTGPSWTVQTEPTALLVPRDTYPRCAVEKPVIGLGQKQLIIGWINPPPPSSKVYFDETYTITKPGGTVLTVKQDSAADGSSSFEIIGDELGTWTVKMSYAGDVINKGSETPLTTWTVQEELVPSTPQQPLPDYPWQFPISAEYQEWYQISGPWQALRYDGERSSFNPYSKGPTSAHILWKTQMVKGGLMGGETGYMSYSGEIETSMGTTFVAAEGRIYYAKPEHYNANLDATGVDTNHYVLYCYDQYTGNLIYRSDLPGKVAGGIAGPMLYLDMSQKFKMDPNTRSAFTLYVYLGGFWAVDPWDGQCTYYNPDIAKASTPGGAGVNDGYMYLTNYPQTGNFTCMQMWNHAIKWTVQAPTNPITGSYIFPYTMSEWLFSNGMTGTVTTIGENPGVRKVYTWNITDGSLIADGVTASAEASTGWIARDGKWISLSNADLKVRATDMRTGQIDWTSPAAEYPWGSFQAYQSASSYGPMGGESGDAGQVYIPSYDGNLYCFSNTDGHLVWKFFCGNTTETGMGHHMPWSEIVIADNKVYFTVGEHTAPYPLPREGKFYCVDARTGELIWSLDGFYDHVWDSRHMAGIVGGIIYYPNMYDGCLYSFGKGESATTVSAPETTVSLGSSVLIQGTVTDQSPGAPGTPAVSDDGQNAWMGYLYMNKPMPTNATGVTVFLQAVGSDGTLMDITHVTSDAMGHYEYTWTPPGEDTYKILATFEGSDSYYSSSAQTGLSVGAASPTPAPPAATSDTALMLTGVAGTGVAVIIAIAIVGILLLRKRK